MILEINFDNYLFVMVFLSRIVLDFKINSNLSIIWSFYIKKAIED